MEVEFKKCNKCHQSKEIWNFVRVRGKHLNICRECYKERSLKYKIKNLWANPQGGIFGRIGRRDPMKYTF